MIITCLSTSNVKSMGDNSVSTKVCNLIKDVITEKIKDDVKVNILLKHSYNLNTMMLGVNYIGK